MWGKRPRARTDRGGQVLGNPYRAPNLAPEQAVCSLYSGLSGGLPPGFRQQGLFIYYRHSAYYEDQFNQR
ncbi:MAG: hypothetical protein EDM77_08265 [Candidatus Jettenia sp. AMX1]|nr:MAG: hypothetical protein EDM77_08265 [Candidatus Jettenia sp. AMX1]MCE7880373.1 hypothetical protein [Candidatus Jettenia sp. AMX1]MCQ3927295.1 hypothetical protein [Candidatus Jettenia sp.]